MLDLLRTIRFYVAGSLPTQLKAGGNEQRKSLLRKIDAEIRELEAREKVPERVID